MSKELFPNVAIIYNPNSGIKTKGEMVDGIAKKIQSKGLTVEVFPTSGPGDATELTSQAVTKGYSIVFAAGGDGTLNEVGKGLVSTDAVLGCIPLGTLNIWAGETGLSKIPEKIVKLIADGQVRKMDTGRINNNLFILMAGVGFDGEVVNCVQQPGKGKDRRGVGQFIEHSLKTLPKYSGIPGKINLDGETNEINLYQAWFGNTRKIAYVVLRPEGKCDDGLLEATIFSNKRDQELSLPVKRNDFQGKEFTIDLIRPVAMQVDGEPLEKAKHIEVRVAPSSLKVLVPKREITVFSKR